MSTGYPLSSKTQEEIKKAKDNIKTIRATQGRNTAKAVFEVIKNSDWGRNVRKEYRDLGKKMQKDREEIDGFFEKLKELDKKEEEILTQLTSIQSSKKSLQQQIPRITELKVKLGYNESVEDLQQVLKQYILERSRTIAHEVREHNQFIDREIGIVTNLFSNNENKKAVERKDVKFVGNPIEKDMKSGKKLLVQHIIIDDIDWIGLKIPESIMNMKLTNFSEELMTYKDHNYFPQMNMNITVREALGINRLVLSKYNQKSHDDKPITNIEIYNCDSETDVLRECLLNGTKPIGLVHALVLREIIKQGLGNEYVDFLGDNTDSEENRYEQVRKILEEIDNYTGLSFSNKNNNYITIGNIEYFIRNRGLYLDKSDNFSAFTIGGGANGCVGGVASISLDWPIQTALIYCGFRPAL